MTPQDIKASCDAARADGADSVILKINGKYPRGIGFPRGELLCQTSMSERVYRFSVEKLEKWLRHWGFA